MKLTRIVLTNYGVHSVGLPARTKLVISEDNTISILVGETEYTPEDVGVTVINTCSPRNLEIIYDMEFNEKDRAVLDAIKALETKY